MTDPMESLAQRVAERVFDLLVDAPRGLGAGTGRRPGTIRRG